MKIYKHTTGKVYGWSDTGLTYVFNIRGEWEPTLNVPTNGFGEMKEIEYPVLYEGFRRTVE